MKEQTVMIRRLAMVIRQEEIAPEIYSMWVRSDAAAYAHAGQFVNVFPRDGAHLLPRPLSICEINQQRTEIRFVYQAKGAGTREFSKYVQGDWLELIGPLGNGFPIEGEAGPAFLIGGGIGVPPMLQLARELTCEKVVVLGFKNVTFLREEFDAEGCEVYVNTENGSMGAKGTVMGTLLENKLGANVIYACGPRPMLAAVKQYAAMRGIRCYLSMEERMACGVGACLGCTCDTKDRDDYYKVNKKCVCKDGPVFNAEEVIL